MSVRLQHADKWDGNVVTWGAVSVGADRDWACSLPLHHCTVQQRPRAALRLCHGADRGPVSRAPAAQHGCLVVNAPTANTVAAAEHGIALICALSRNVAQADASVKAGKWERSKFTGVSIVGKTLAVMGFGKVRTFC